MLVAELNTTRRLGVEIECAVPQIGAGGQTDVQQTIARILTANGVPACSRDGYGSRPVPNGMALSVEQDGSVRGESQFQGITWTQLEVKTRVLSGWADFQAVVPRTLEVLSYCGARVNQSTGLHLNLDVASEVRENPRFITRMLNLFWKWQNVLYGLVPPSRRTCGFANPMPDHRDEWNRCRSLRTFYRALHGWSRYTFLNICHLWTDSPRVEVRLHSGTLDPVKVSNFVIFMNRLLDHAATRSIQKPSKQAENTRRNLERMFVSAGLKPNSGIYQKVAPELRACRKYLLRRWKHFNGAISLKSPAAKFEKDPF